MDWKDILSRSLQSLKSLVLIGPAGCGKTTTIKHFCPKPALFVTHIDTLKQFIPNYHKCIIFDDISFTHWPRETQISIVDLEQPRAIHIRYGTATIPGGITKIFTANKDPLNSEDQAIKRRTKYITIN